MRIKNKYRKKTNLKRLDDLFKEEVTIEKGKPLKKIEISKGRIPVIAGGRTSPYTHNVPTHSIPCVTISTSGAYAGYVQYHTIPIWASDCNVIYSQTNLTEYLYYALKSKQQQIYNLQSGGGQPHVYAKDIKKLTIFLPPLSEQKAISSLLEKWDIAIEKTESLIDAKQKQFEWLVTSLINKSKHKKSHLSEFVEEVSNRNRNSALDRVLSVTNHSGFVLPEEQFQRRVASTNTSNYKIVKRGQYAYNPARINVGSIARLDHWDNGIISPMYIVFKLNLEKVENNYFLYWLSSNEAKQRIRNSAQGGVRKTVSFDDLCIIRIALPNISTQKTITKILDVSQHEITLLKQLAEKYRIQKRGLMQKLLTGKWRISKNNLN